MAKSTNTENRLLVFANREDLASKLQADFDKSLGTRKACVVVCTNNVDSGDDQAFSFPTKADLKKQTIHVKRLLIIFEGRPVHLESMKTWRTWATEKDLMPSLFDLRMAFVPSNGDDEAVKKAVKSSCASWFESQLPPEKPAGIEIKSWVKMPEGDHATRKDDPSLLTMMFGSMGELLNGLDVAARSFKEAVGRRSSGTEREAYLDKIDELLAKPAPRSGKARRAKPGNDGPKLGLSNINDRIPKVLLLGETGVGKTLITRYLHERSGLADNPLHISIPEYLGKEDMFEYTLFGYAAGNYTGGKADGDHGLLLENVCRVVFLDEIGEANSIIQAKLLTFLDHFNVRPRGWKGDPFYCPVLIVAATNRPLSATMKSGERLFRNDLYRRFTDVLRIPPLRKRKQDFDFILDCLLQRNSMNPGRFVTEIGAEALKYLKGLEFEEGNFRELEDLFRTACRRAYRDDRPYLIREDCEKDFEKLT